MSLLIESELVTPTRKSDTAPDALPDAVNARAAVIRLEQVTVEYRAPRERIRTFKEYAIRLLQGGVKHEEFQALREVTFDVREGEVFGVIGHNGAGKSTLLKVISRVLKPTRGRVRVQGRVAPLLELGAGFHPELSGRENVFLNGTLLGFKRAEIEAMFDDIVDFADLWDFIDAPLRTYSTGMGMRLGFAVATAARPDVLIVDEVLAVGDENFQDKCAARMAEFRQNGTTVLLVTHDVGLALAICDRAALLDHGQLRAIGPVGEVVEAYHSAITESRATHRSGKATDADSVADKKPSAVARQNAPAADANPLEELVLKRKWFYRFDLPSGRQTDCSLPPGMERIHETRWTMIEKALEPLPELTKGAVSLTALDVGCNQGYFALKLAGHGFRHVVGIDARAVNIQDADLIRRACGIDNLHFRHLDLLRINPKEFGQFDVVLLLGLIFQTENPIGMLRAVKGLARRMVIIEAQFAPEAQGSFEWGGRDFRKEVHGSFAVIDQKIEKETPVGGLSDLSLCPGREALFWTMKRLGFARVEILPPPADAYEQFARGHRALVAGYL